jgi:putative sterol carrier protein
MPGSGPASQPWRVADATQRFFEQLARHGHEPLLEKASGVMRFDLTEGEQTEHWLLVIKDGDVRITRDVGDADAILHADRTVFNKIAIGELNALVALLSGQAAVDGDLELAVMLQRLLPGPSSRARPRSRPQAGQEQAGEEQPVREEVRHG